MSNMQVTLWIQVMLLLPDAALLCSRIFRIRHFFPFADAWKMIVKRPLAISGAQNLPKQLQKIEGTDSETRPRVITVARSEFVLRSLGSFSCQYPHIVMEMLLGSGSETNFSRDCNVKVIYLNTRASWKISITFGHMAERGFHHLPSAGMNILRCCEECLLFSLCCEATSGWVRETIQSKQPWVPQLCTAGLSRLCQWGQGGWGAAVEPTADSQTCFLSGPGLGYF